MSSKSDRRARQRERKRIGENEEYHNALPSYIHSRIVCDKCGLEQPFRANLNSRDPRLAPCKGPLGLPCDSETAVFLDSMEIGELP